MLAGNARVVTLYVHLYDTILAEMFSCMLLDTSFGHRSKNKIWKLNMPEKAVENLLLDPLKFLRNLLK
jgi:hypothetical protein